MSGDRRRVLVIEDDHALAKAVANLLQDAGFAVEQRHDGESGFAEGLGGEYDVIVLDLMLPKRNGFQRLSGPARRRRRHPAVDADGQRRRVG